MSIVLPKEPVKATRISPKILVLYSLPKVGKTEQLSLLPGCLTLDTEDGTDIYDMVKVKITNMYQIDEVIAAILAEGAKRAAEGKQGLDRFPYQFIAVDTLDRMEDYAEKAATDKYRKSVMNRNKKFEENGYTSITELPDGNGYKYLREEVMEAIEKLSAVCPRLILIVHVREKLMLNKDNAEVKVNDINMTGKLASMVCAKADGIGYMYRSPKGELKVNFKTYDGAVMGMRQKYLAGKDIPFSWEVIYPDLFGEPEKASANGTTAKAVTA